MVDGVCKVGGLGVGDYSRPGQEADPLRWTAQEAIGASAYHGKCDVWSYACLLWEAVTLGEMLALFCCVVVSQPFFPEGGTPYGQVKTAEVGSRVQRGLRLPRTQPMSDDIYQLMLECWQTDLDERPTFQQIRHRLQEMAAQGATVSDELFSHITNVL